MSSTPARPRPPICTSNRATHELAKEHRTRVVSSDGAEQIIVMGHGAFRVSARAFEEEVRAVEKEIREFLEE